MISKLFFCYYFTFPLSLESFSSVQLNKKFLFLTHWHDISYLTLRHCKSRASRCRNRIWQAVSGYTQKLWKQNKSNHRVLYFIDKVYLLCWHAGDCFQCKCTYAVLFISSKCIWLHLIDAACQSLFNLFMNLLFFFLLLFHF